MTPQEARELLLLHSGGHEDISHPKMANGFLGLLRPYTGLNEENFYETMEAIRVLAPEFQGNAIDKEIMCALWNLCWQASLTGLHSLGALQRNDIITRNDLERLEDWIFQISYTISLLLEGQDIDSAFQEYDVNMSN